MTQAPPPPPDLRVVSPTTASTRTPRPSWTPDTFIHGAPFDALARLRREAPVHPVDLPGLPPIWLLTRNADVARVSRDDRTFSSDTGNTLIEGAAAGGSALLPSLDPPRHTRFRKLINQGFTVRNVKRLEPSIRRTAKNIVATIMEKGEFDAVSEISAEMGLHVIAEVLGVPEEDRFDIFRWSNAIGSLGIEDPDYAASPEALGQAAGEMYQYFKAEVRRRRDEPPKDDIIAALLAAEVDGERLRMGQLMEFFMLLAIAGNETTRNTLSHTVLALSHHPDQRRALAQDPSRVPAAVEEMLRWSTPVMHFRRRVTTDVEVGGQRLKAGDWVLMHYLSANRDEDVFERPEQFDIDRADTHHAAFGGGGTHFCLGAQLARLELRVMLEELYTACPGLTVTDEPVRLRSSFFHGIKQLPCAVSQR